MRMIFVIALVLCAVALSGWLLWPSPVLHTLESLPAPPVESTPARKIEFATADGWKPYGVPFRKLTFENAQKVAARDQKKLILVLESQTQPADDTAWAYRTESDKSKRVFNYLNDNIAIRLHSEEQGDLRQTLQFDGEPLIVVFDASGKELARRIGECSAQELGHIFQFWERPEERKRILDLGKRELERLATHPEDNVSWHLSHSAALLQCGRTEEAIEELIQAWDESADLGQAVRRSFAIEVFADWAQCHNSAHVALRTRRESLLNRVYNNGSPTQSDVDDLQSIGRAMDISPTPLEIYNSIDGRADTKILQHLKSWGRFYLDQTSPTKATIQEEGLRRARYQTRLALDWLRMRDVQYKAANFESDITNEKLLAHSYLYISTYVEMLIRIGRAQAAAEICKEAREANPSVEMSNLLPAAVRPK